MENSKPKSRYNGCYYEKKTNDLLIAINHFNPNQYQNIMPLIEALDKISVLPGYAIGMFEVTDLLRLYYKIYAFRLDHPEEFIPKYADKNLVTHRKILHFLDIRINHPIKALTTDCYQPGMHITGIQQKDIEQQLPSVYTFINVERTEKGIWQLYLFGKLQDFLSGVWNGLQKGRYYFISNRDLYTFNDMLSLSSFTEYQLLPRVTITGHEFATVDCCFFSLNEGLCKESVLFKRMDDIIMPFSTQQKILVPYQTTSKTIFERRPIQVV